MKKIDLFNRALSRISDNRYVDGTQQAAACENNFRSSIDEVLTMARWSFATKHTSLSMHSSCDGVTTFYIPDDCLRLLDVDAPHYKLAQNNSLILDRHVERVKITYISNENFGSNYECIPLDADPLFINAVVILLAHKMCMVLTGDKNLELALMQEFQNVVMPQAALINKYQDSSNDQHPLRDILNRGLLKNNRHRY